MSKAMPNESVRRMMAGSAIKRCITVKTNTTKSVKINREAVGRVVTYCAIIAVQNIFELGRDGIERLMAEMTRRSEVYTVEADAFGVPKARENLKKRAEEKMAEPFVMPVEKWPKKDWEKVLMYERRSAGGMVVHFLVEAMDVLGYDREQVAAAVKETCENYRQFLGWAKEDGEYVAYVRMGRAFQQSTGIEVAIEDDMKDQTIFGKKF